MPDRSRHLVGSRQIPPPPAPAPPGDSSAPVEATLDSDFVVILAALLCAAICVFGLAAVARCAWIRRISGRNPDVAQPGDALRRLANKGLKKKALKSLPKLTYGEDEKQSEKLSECAICLAEFIAGEEVRVLPQCGHGFHVVCIDTWLRSHSSCPSCRQILVVARCQKCGNLPVDAGTGGGRVQSQLSEILVNRFLP